MSTSDRAEREAADAQWLFEHRDELEDTDDEEEVVVVAQPLSVTTSIRMSREEAAAIRQAAEDAGMKQSEWIRMVCLSMARQPIDSAPARSIVPLVQGLMERLSEAREAEDKLRREADRLLNTAEAS